ncbi:Sodium- and chloride-dependent GABA transporter 1 [Binucleata daphniae]
MDEKTIKCSNCETVVTPLWRRGCNGSYLCNACGLYYKIHNSNRPIEMKSDSFRHRQRSKKTDDVFVHKSSYIKKADKNNTKYEENANLSSEYDDRYDDAMINYIKTNKNKTKIRFINNDKLSKKIKAFKNIEKSLKREIVDYIDDSNSEENKKQYGQDVVLTEEEKNLSIEELEKIAVEVLVSLSKLTH